MYRLKTIDLIPLEGKWKMRRANSKAVLSKLLVKFFFLDVDGTLNIYKKMTNVTDTYICTCVTNFSMVIVFCPTFFSLTQSIIIHYVDIYIWFVFCPTFFSLV